MNSTRNAIYFAAAIVFTLRPLLAQDAPPPSNPAQAAEVMSNPLAQLGQMLERDWADRPEWAQMATMILKGEDMGPGRGWFKPGENRYSWDWMLQTFDADKNGTIDGAEAGGEAAAKYFAALDRSGDGGLTAADFEPRSGNRSDPSSMLASMLFRMLDDDSNGKVTSDEISLLFLGADEQGAGFLSIADLQNLFRDMMSMPGAPPPGLAAEYQPGIDPLKDLDMLLSGQYGSLTPGPAIDQPAPDFTLPRQDGTGTVTLSQLRGKPVALIFGSFT